MGDGYLLNTGYYKYEGEDAGQVLQYHKRCDNANEMLTFTPLNASTRNMTFDNNGNLLTVSNSCGTTNYTWNARNRLVGINGFKADCSPLTASFKYDALGRRIEKTINGVTTRYLYDGFDIIQEKNASGTVTANYIRTLNIDEPLTRIKSDGTIRHYVTDALGSVIALTDDTGVVRTTYTYDPFGNVTVSGESSDNPFQYTGRENDGIGLYYYRARYYSPDLQRFISEDPIGLAGGVNKFSYVRNSPCNWVDPLGLKCKKPFWSRVGENFIVTNDVIPGLLAPWGVGFITGSKVAEATGGITLLKWARTAFRGATLQGVAFSRLSTGIIAGATTFTNFAIVGLAWEAGVGIGSIISAAILPCEEEIESPKDCK